MVKLESLYTVGENVNKKCNRYANSTEIHQKLKVELAYEPGTPLWDIYPKEWLLPPAPPTKASALSPAFLRGGSHVSVTQGHGYSWRSCEGLFNASLNIDVNK